MRISIGHEENTDSCALSSEFAGRITDGNGGSALESEILGTSTYICAGRFPACRIDSEERGTLELPFEDPLFRKGVQR